MSDNNATDGDVQQSDKSTSGIERSRSRDFGHTRKGYAVEFNLDGICACRTLTVESRDVAEHFARQLESMDATDSVEVVSDV